VEHLRSAVEGHLGCGRQLALESPDDQNTHGVSPRRPNS
jgi:hypothetical protein